MLQSLFEPLHTLEGAHTMEKGQLPLISQAASLSSLFTISPPPSPSFLPLHAINTIENTSSCSDQTISCSLHAHIINPSSYKKARSEQDFMTSDFTHVNQQQQLLLPPHSALSALASSSSSPCSINGNSSYSDLSLSRRIPFLAKSAPSSICDDHNCSDDGSVASKLLSSITKSISSPSLQLASCKESARETPYQKTLKLKQMKLHHCAEELGMESSDNSAFAYTDRQHIPQESINNMRGNAPSFPQESSLRPVRSLPNLNSASPLMPIHSRCTRTTSFPPPLSHTLPDSSSSGSLSFSLRAYREDGRFILKETMVPSKHYFHASRKDGRLTLHVVTRDVEEAIDNEVDSFAKQDEDAECSYRIDKLQGEELVEAEEGVNAKKYNDMHSFKESNAAKSHVDMSMQRMNCKADHHNHNNEDDKSNVMSKVITFSLKTSTHSKVTLHKAQVLSYPIVSSPLQQSAFKRNHGFLQSNHELSKLLQPKQKFVWESNLKMRPCAVASTHSGQHIQRKGSGCSGGGHGSDAFEHDGAAARAPAFVIDEMRAKSLMKAVTALASSLLLESSYGDFCKPVLSVIETRECGTILGGHANAIDNAIINGRIISKDGQINQSASFGYNTSYLKEEEQASHEVSKELHVTPSPLLVDLQLPFCNGNLQCEERLNNLYCKELFDRHYLNIGHDLNMKLPCIPTRS